MRPRPSDDPVMNTRATLTPPYEPNAIPAPRVFPFTLCAARRSVLRFYASNKFGLDILERRVPAS